MQHDGYFEDDYLIRHGHLQLFGKTAFYLVCTGTYRRNLVSPTTLVQLRRIHVHRYVRGIVMSEALYLTAKYEELY